MNFWKGVFSDGAEPSFSRVCSGVHSLVASGCLIFVVWHSQHLPDAVTLGGLGAFTGVPYALNQARNALGK